MIDACMHHRWVDESEVHPYIEEGWRHYVGEPRSIMGTFGARRLVPLTRYHNPMGDDLADAQPPDGGPAGSSPQLLEDQVLSRFGVERALLLYDRAMFAPSHPNPFYATAIVRAINDWNIDTWLSRDERLYGTALVPEQVPDEAVTELRRVAANPKIVAVTLSPSIGRLLGHPLYNPIYEAASELGLPVVIHRGIDTMTDARTGTAAGPPYTFAEYQTLAPLALMTNVMSLATNGVFARYPELRFFIVGGGLAWAEALLLRIDTLWRSLRRDFPWVHEPPSSYFARQVRISTYGLERGAPETLQRLVERKPELRNLTVYGSGYPSWDTLWPAEVEELLPAGWHESVFRDNAEAWFRWQPHNRQVAGTAVEQASG
jgi:predicted TIM-barrel fold metal-dependent hydrolase